MQHWTIIICASCGVYRDAGGYEDVLTRFQAANLGGRFSAASDTASVKGSLPAILRQAEQRAAARMECPARKSTALTRLMSPPWRTPNGSGTRA